MAVCSSRNLSPVSVRADSPGRGGNLGQGEGRPSGGGKGEHAQSVLNIINIDPRAEGRANGCILIETSSIATLGQRQ